MRKPYIYANTFLYCAIINELYLDLMMIVKLLIELLFLVALATAYVEEEWAKDSVNSMTSCFFINITK